MMFKILKAIHSVFTFFHFVPNDFLQIIMAILVSWLLCFIFTVTDVFPPEPDKYGFYARTDARQGILAAAPWFKIPYPCKCYIIRKTGIYYTVHLLGFKAFFYFYSSVGRSNCNSCWSDRDDECCGGQHYRINWRLLCLRSSVMRSTTSHPCH